MQLHQHSDPRISRRLIDAKVVSYVLEIDAKVNGVSSWHSVVATLYGGRESFSIDISKFNVFVGTQLLDVAYFVALGSAGVDSITDEGALSVPLHSTSQSVAPVATLLSLPWDQTLFSSSFEGTTTASWSHTSYGNSNSVAVTAPLSVNFNEASHMPTIAFQAGATSTFWRHSSSSSKVADVLFQTSPVGSAFELVVFSSDKEVIVGP